MDAFFQFPDFTNLWNSGNLLGLTTLYSWIKFKCNESDHFASLWIINFHQNQISAYLIPHSRNGTKPINLVLSTNPIFPYFSLPTSSSPMHIRLSALDLVRVMWNDFPLGFTAQCANHDNTFIAARRFSEEILLADNWEWLNVPRICVGPPWSRQFSRFIWSICKTRHLPRWLRTREFLTLISSIKSIIVSIIFISIANPGSGGEFFFVKCINPCYIIYISSWQEI